MAHLMVVRCISCNLIYNEQKRRPCKGKCGHSICLQCKNSLENQKCTLCNREDAFEETTIDYQFIEILVKLRESLTVDYKRDFCFSDSDSEQGLCSECSEMVSNLRICVTCSQQLLISHDDKKWFLLKSHLDISKEKLKCMAVCGSCAIDNHKEHGHRIIKMCDVFGTLDENEQLGFLNLHNQLYREKVIREDYCGKFKEFIQNIELRISNFSLCQNSLIGKLQIGEQKIGEIHGFLQRRSLMYQREIAIKYKEELTQLKEKNEELKKVLLKLEELIEKLEIYELSSEDVKKIDEETDELIDELTIKNEDSNYFDEKEQEAKTKMIEKQKIFEEKFESMNDGLAESTVNCKLEMDMLKLQLAENQELDFQKVSNALNAEKSIKLVEEMMEAMADYYNEIVEYEKIKRFQTVFYLTSPLTEDFISKRRPMKVQKL